MTSPTTDISLLARDLRIDIDTGTVPETPVWSQLMAVFDVKPIIELKTADDSANEDAGWDRDAIVGAGWRIELSIHHRKTAAGTSRNAVHKFIRDKYLAGAQGTVADAQFGIRCYHRDGLDSGYEFSGVAYPKSWDQDKTGNTDLGDVKIVLQGQGPIEIIANPEAGGGA